jgi:hypothetical protein
MILDFHFYIGVFGACFSLINFGSTKQIAWVSNACFALAYALHQ